MNESNAILAKRVLDNDEAAFATLFGRHRGRVYRACLRILGHHQDAEDMTQETFSRAARYLQSWDSRRPFEPWLIAIAGNRCRSLLASRRGHCSLSPLAEPMVVGDQAATSVMLSEEIELVLSRLPDHQRQAFELFHRHSRGYQEIAEELKRPVGTIKTWIHRARTELIQELRKREVIHLNGGHGDRSPRVGAGERS